MGFQAEPAAQEEQEEPAADRLERVEPPEEGDMVELPEDTVALLEEDMGPLVDTAPSVDTVPSVDAVPSGPSVHMAWDRAGQHSLVVEQMARFSCIPTVFQITGITEIHCFGRRGEVRNRGVPQRAVVVFKMETQ